MKQLWYGTALLIFLFAAGLFLGNHLENAWAQPIRDLGRAADAAMEENWARADAHLTRAEKEWEEKRNRSAMIYRQDALEQIDGLFAQLRAELACRSREGFCANCAILAKYLENLPQSHSFHWQNLL